jgi:hypothetical protein
MPTKLEEFRKQYPQYDDVPDRDLADALYDKFYSDGPNKLEQNDFYRQIGLGNPPSEQGELTEANRVQSQQGFDAAFYSAPPQKTEEEKIYDYFDAQSRAMRREEETAVRKEKQEKAAETRREQEKPLMSMIEEAKARYNDPNTPFLERAMLFFNIGQMSQAASGPSVAAAGRKAIVETVTAVPEMAMLGLAVMSPTAADAVYQSDFATKLKELKDKAAGETTSEEDIAANIATFFTGAGLAKRGTKALLTARMEEVNRQFGKKIADDVQRKILETTGQTMAVKPKTIPISAEQAKQISRGSTGAATAVGVSIDVQLSDGDQAIMQMLAEVPVLGPLAEALTINPEDTVTQEKLKEAITSAGLTGVVTGLFKTPQAFLSALNSTVGKIKGMNNAVNSGALNVPPPSPNAAVVQSSLVQTGQQTFEQRNIIVETIAKINTAFGRGLQSSATLPKELHEAYIRKSNAGRSYEIVLKKITKDLQEVKDKFKISDEDTSAYLVNKIDNNLPQELKSELDKIRDLIETNQSTINSELGLAGKKALGVDYKNGEVYITRTFDATGNPEYLAKIKSALDGKAAPVADADFITKVENARTYLRGMMVSKPNTAASKNFVSLTPEQQSSMIDSTIYDMVQNLSGENKSFVRKLLDGTATSSVSDVSTSLVKVLKARKELDEPILNLLGVTKDPVRNAAVTLQNQNKLLAEIDYLKTVEQFAKQNKDVVFDIGGMFKFLPSVRTKFSTTPFVESQNLADVTAQSVGKFGGTTGGLAKVFTTPQMARYISNGTNLWDWNNKLGSTVGDMFAKLAGFGQATKTVLNFPAYLTNTFGAATNLAANGHILSPTAWKNAMGNVKILVNQITANDQKAVDYLSKLKLAGVIDTDITGEIIARNANILGKDPVSFLSKTYQKSMQKLGSLYGQPDNYMKLLAHQVETAQLKSMFPKASSDEIFDMAAERVRNTMPTYSSSSPFVRELSKMPFGTFALYPTEIFRTSKNIVKYSLSDIGQGIASGNAKQVAYGLKRLSAFGVTLGGFEYYARTNNQALGVTDENQRVVDVLSPEWGKGSNRVFLESFKEGSDGTIKTRFASSSSYDAYDVLKVPVRLLTGKVLGGEKVSDFEVDQALKGMYDSVVGPYTNLKFVSQALLNVVSGIDTKTGKPIYDQAVGTTATDKAITAAAELGKAITPGTAKLVLDYLKSLNSEELRGLYEGVNASGFPLSSKDIETRAKTGISTTTMNVDKAIGSNLANDVKAINATEASFMKFVSEMPDQQYTEELGRKIVDKYREYQQRKFEGMVDLSDKIKLIESMKYFDKNGNERNYGIDRIFMATTDKGFYKAPEEIFYARQSLVDNKKGSFVPDRVFDKTDLRKMLHDKKYPPSLANDLAQVFKEFAGKKLEREKK